MDAEKASDNPFLTGVEAIVEAIRTGQIKCNVYNRDKFHAKAYITLVRMEAVGSQALVGSSNFTCPGLNQNIELNIKLESGPEVTQLQRWYENHWGVAVEVTDGILTPRRRGSPRRAHLAAHGTDHVLTLPHAHRTTSMSRCCDDPLNPPSMSASLVHTRILS